MSVGKLRKGGLGWPHGNGKLRCMGINERGKGKRKISYVKKGVTCFKSHLLGL